MTSEARALLAGLASSLAAASTGILLFALDGFPLDPMIFGYFLVFALPVALGHAVFLAAPLYYALNRCWPLRWWNAGLAGFVVGAVPASLLALPDIGEITLGGGVCGLVGGLVFRAIRGPVPARPDRGRAP